MLSVKSKSHLSRKTPQTQHHHHHRGKTLPYMTRFVKDQFYHIASENPPISFDGKFVKYLGKKAVFETAHSFERNEATITKDDYEKQNSPKKKGILEDKFISGDEIFLPTTTRHEVDLDHITNAEKIINLRMFINEDIFTNHAQELEFTY